MSNTTIAKKIPAYRIYSVTKNGEQAVWQEIGAAWKHKDGKGRSAASRCRSRS